MEKCESAAGLGLVREGVAEVDAEEDVAEVETEDVDRTGDGEEEVVDGLGAAQEECEGVTAEEEEDFKMGDLGTEEEELVLEDVALLFE